MADGGMGTSLIEQGEPIGTCFELLNVSDPQRIVGIHRSYVRAGSDIVLTNTFGGNRFRLECPRPRRAGDRAQPARRWPWRVMPAPGSSPVRSGRSACALRLRPCQAGGRVRRVPGAGGRARGGRRRPVGRSRRRRTCARWSRRSRPRARGLRRHAVVVSATFTNDDRTLLGRHPPSVARRLRRARGRRDRGELRRGSRAVAPRDPRHRARVAPAAIPLMARPNAGGPTQVGGRFVYPATPEYLGEHARAFLDEGVAIIGGCCGTGPAHTRGDRGRPSAIGAPHARVVLTGARRDEPTRRPPATAPPTICRPRSPPATSWSPSRWSRRARSTRRSSSPRPERSRDAACRRDRCRRQSRWRRCG